MAANDNYLQFPLCLLGLPIEAPTQKAIERIRLMHIIYYGLVEFANKLGAEETVHYYANTPPYTPTYPKEYLVDKLECVPKELLPAGFDPDRREHLLFAYAQKMLGINNGSIPTAYESWELCTEYAYGHRHVEGKGRAFARFRGDIIMDAYKGKLDWRLFSVLAAVYTIIGREKVKCIRRPLIQVYQTGCESVEMMRAKGIEPLSISKIRTALETLEERGLIGRIEFTCRDTWYSKGLKNDEMWEAAKIVNKRYAQGKVKARRKLDAIRRKTPWEDQFTTKRL